MKLREVIFDRYCGRDQRRKFTSAEFHIDLDVETRLILITPRVVEVGKPIEPLILVAHNVDMYQEPDVPEAPARALPGKPRART